jgi:hypothetical protein
MYIYSNLQNLKCAHKAGNFTALVYSVLLNTGKNVLKMTQILWKNSLIIAKDVQITHVNFTVTAIKFSKKNLEALLLYHPCNLIIMVPSLIN